MSGIGGARTITREMQLEVEQAELQLGIQLAAQPFEALDQLRGGRGKGCIQPPGLITPDLGVKRVPGADRRRTQFTARRELACLST